MMTMMTMMTMMIMMTMMTMVTMMTKMTMMTMMTMMTRLYLDIKDWTSVESNQIQALSCPVKLAHGATYLDSFFSNIHLDVTIRTAQESIKNGCSTVVQ